MDIKKESIMKTTSVKGTNDFLPKDSALRDFLQSQILTTYVSQGFGRIYTPVLEDIENLEKSDGGDNVSLIFKVLKRGEKFNSAISNWETKSKSWQEYCKKYPTVQQYDKHLDALEKDEKKEFFADIVNNTNLYSHMYKIIDVITAEQELTL